ncbi:MAG: hypothetical protein Q7J65_09080 [Candidatus Marinimicrobia bacterium]|nr:hypothetical protein [Candidatus Neomarinimicrobiota bacterium]
MKARTYLLISLFLIFAVAVFINGCSENSISNPSDPARSVGIHVDDIQWVSAKPEFTSKMTALKKSVIDGKLITVANGGVVGSENTLNNMVEFPANAVGEDTYVTVEVKYNKHGIFYVEFLPGGTFNEFVDVTLSWAYLDIGDEENIIAELNIYFSQDGGKYWFPVDSEVMVDYGSKTATFKTNHFSRYGWGI